MRGRLTIEAGDGAPEICALHPDHRVTLGRNRNNTIILQDKHASRFHAEVFAENGRWMLRDIDTLNGTRVSGARVRHVTPLGDGQEITIGDTVLRFTLETAEAGALNVVEMRTPLEMPGVSPPPESELSKTALQADELTALCDFMASSVQEDTPRALISKALEAVHRQAGAAVTGFLSFDPDDPLPKMTLPEQAHVDVHLSRRLTAQARRDGRLVWLGPNAAGGLDNDSLLSFKDALCVPLRAGDAVLGALHAYRSGKLFGEREVRFCELLAGYLANSLGVLRSRRALEADLSRLRVHAAAADDELIGDSAAMQQVQQHVGRVADRPCTVLIVGESGVGKELVALALHRQSPRREGPLVTVNCASIAATLTEAELFGHRKGTFTGADRDRPGYFQQAEDGTLFLDEIGELPLECQAKLLRVLETKRYRPVGAEQEIKADVRIIAATNRDLEKEVRESRFRQDLYFRLGIPVRVPPLREHAADIPALVNHFLRKFSVEYRRQTRLTPAALARLQAYSWPGNVRQLRSVLENAVAMSESDVIDAGDLRLDSDGRDVAGELPCLNLEELEALAIRQALKEAGGTVIQAAKLLGVHRETLVTKMKKYGIEKTG